MRVADSHDHMQEQWDDDRTDTTMDVWGGVSFFGLGWIGTSTARLGIVRFFHIRHHHHFMVMVIYIPSGQWYRGGHGKRRRAGFWHWH